MVATPLVDASWHRVQQDTFSSRPDPSTPLDPSSFIPDDTEDTDDADDSGSDWSYQDEEQLVTLDLGTDRIARRALLGYSAGLDQLDPEPTPSASASARTVRSAHHNGGNLDAAKQSNPSTSLSTAGAGDPSSNSGRNGPHLGAGKMLSITGLETATPLMKIDDTVLRGRRMDMFGTEIVLVDQFDPTRPKGYQHRLRPVSPSTLGETRATTSSSTTRTRLLFRPIYDPSSRETAAGDTAAYNALRALVKPSHSQHVSIPTPPSEHEQQAMAGSSLASVTNLSGAELGAGEEWTEPEKRLGRGKYKRKQVPEEEQMIRAAERKIRKAAKAHRKQQEQQQQQEAAAQTAQVQEEESDDVLAQQQHQHQQEQQQRGAVQDETQPMQDAQPPPSFDQS